MLTLFGSQRPTWCGANTSSSQVVDGSTPSMPSIGGLTSTQNSSGSSQASSAGPSLSVPGQGIPTMTTGLCHQCILVYIYWSWSQPSLIWWQRIGRILFFLQTGRLSNSLHSAAWSGLWSRNLLRFFIHYSCLLMHTRMARWPLLLSEMLSFMLFWRFHLVLHLCTSESRTIGSTSVQYYLWWALQTFITTLSDAIRSHVLEFPLFGPISKISAAKLSCLQWMRSVSQLILSDSLRSNSLISRIPALEHRG